MSPAEIVTPLPTPAERAAAGKEARTRVPRSSHGGWVAPPERADPVAILEAQAVSRVPELVPIRYGRMLETPFTFFRGAAAIMAADLAQTPNAGERVQLCGDAHLLNFGIFAAPDRDLIFDLNDFDETLPGPWEWDVKRLAASVLIAARDNGLPAADQRNVVLTCVRSYREAMREYAEMGNLDVWYSRIDVDHLVDQLRASNADPEQLQALDRTATKARRKNSLRAFDKLTHVVNGKLEIISDPPLIVPIEAFGVDPLAVQHQESQFAQIIENYRASLGADRCHLLADFRYTHAAHKVVGVGSVGTRAWILLMKGRDDADPLFLQAKEAQASVLEPYLGASEYPNHGQRVVEGQRLMQAASDIFLGWLPVIGLDDVPRDFYMRQLWDGKGSADVATMSSHTLEGYVGLCGRTLARAHARSGDRIAIASYLGPGAVFDEAIATFSVAYADQNERDHASLQAAVDAGRIEAAPGLN